MGHHVYTGSGIIQQASNVRSDVFRSRNLINPESGQRSMS